MTEYVLEDKVNNPDMRWYIVHTYSQFEKSVKKSLEDMIIKNNLQEYFGEIMIPIERIIGAGKDSTRVSERKFYPGYVLIQMILNDTTWSLVKSVPKVTYFVGTKNKPQPLSNAEVAHIMNQQKEGATKSAKPKESFAVGDQVKVINGPFVNFPAVIDDIRNGKLRVSINIFGRETPVELELVDVELWRD